MNHQSMKPIRFIGFAGHRQVADKVAALRAIRQELDRMCSGSGAEYAGVSSAAAGADLLFLEACRMRGMKTVVLLPFTTERFREDFGDPDEWQRACECLDAAWWSEVCPGGEEAPEAYHVVAREILQCSSRMLFVWDGQAPRGLGGTAESIADARELGIPSRIIDAATFESRWDGGAPPEERPDALFEDLPASADVAELFDLLDRRASGSAP